MAENNPMNMWSECKFCETWIPDPDGNSYWEHEPLKKHSTKIVCDACKHDERRFKLIHEFATKGTVYDGPYGERHVDHCVEEILKKFAPKSDYRYTYLEIDLRAVWEAEELFRVRDNMPKWHARDKSET